MSNIDTMLERYGEEELRKWQSKGGRARVAKGFSMLTPAERREMGKRGGKKSRRPKRAG